MKRLIACVLLIVLVFSLAACGGEQAESLKPQSIKKYYFA